MRSDIAKVVFERGRRGRSWDSKIPRPAAALLERACEQFDESDNDVRRKRYKMRSSNTGPLKNFLKCRVGQPWDEVWIEVCAATDIRSPLGKDVRRLIGSLVWRDCWIDGSTVMRQSFDGAAMNVWGFYIDPNTGLLQHAPEER